MELVKLKTKNDVADYVANQVVNAIKDFIPSENKPYLVLGLPTGSTPIPVYKRLVEEYKSGNISFKNVVTFNMDEYVGLDENHIQSYHYFMNENLFNHIDIPKNQIFILNGKAEDVQKECDEYERKIKEYGGIDIQLGGIGENGHLAFNEPGTSFDEVTHLQALTQNTIEVNSRFFENKNEVPTHALTIGLKTIFDAKRVLIMATGSKKANAVYYSVYTPISVDCPASVLQKHNNAKIICDEDVWINSPENSARHYVEYGIDFDNNRFGVGRSVEVEFDDGYEYRTKEKFKLCNKSYYIRIWIGKKVFIYSKDDGFEIRTKGRNNFKVIFGFGGDKV